jgi:hypothetical protein
MITQKYLKERLNYNHVTGEFIWINSKSNGTRNGSVAGGMAGKGYRRIMIDGFNYKEHRLAWLYFHGSLPSMLDHINGNRSDNRIKNLRIVSPIENQRNMKAYSTNTSGIVGVRFDKRMKKWHARINVKSKSIHLGVFSNKEDAIKKRIAAEKEYGFHENHGRLK